METLVLISGGLDSAVLLVYEAQLARVHPVHVSVGLAWEAAERAVLARFLESPILDGRAAPLARGDFSMRDIYPPSHWAMRGTPPAYDTPDEDVYLAGRNLVLLTKAGALAASRKLERVVLGPLAGNPFPDATPEFFDAMGKALSIGLSHPVEIATPFASMDKQDVIKIGAELGVPFELTLSCMNPAFDEPFPIHCGLCSKCRERRDAFAASGIADPARYRNESPR